MKQNLVLLFLVLSTAGTAAAVGTPLPLADSDFYYGGAPDPGKVELGRLLFFNTA